MKPHKFSHMVGTESVPYVYPNVWEVEQTTEPEHLIIASSAEQIELMLELTKLLSESFGVLYVLTVPHGSGSEPGRYQNVQPSTRTEMETLLKRFRRYFESDARHHLWVTSLPSSALLVYDNHNVIYAYGPLDEFKEVLRASDLTEGQVRFPFPHAHNYNSEFDEDER